MPTIGFYFRGLTQTEVNALRGRLNELAARHGYLARRSPTKGRGNLAAMLVGIDAGELAVVSLHGEHVVQALDHLDALAIDDRWPLKWAADIAAAVRDALGRQCATEEREMDKEYNERDENLYQGDDRVRQIDWLRQFAANVSDGEIGVGTAEELVEFALSTDGRVSWNISLPQWFDHHDQELLTEMVRGAL